MNHSKRRGKRKAMLIPATILLAMSLLTTTVLFSVAASPDDAAESTPTSDQSNNDQENNDQQNNDQQNNNQQDNDQQNNDQQNNDQENNDQQNNDQENNDQQNNDQENNDQENPDQENPDDTDEPIIIDGSVQKPAVASFTTKLNEIDIRVISKHGGVYVKNVDGNYESLDGHAISVTPGNLSIFIDTDAEDIQVIYADDQGISDIDVSKLSSLKALQINYNSLTSLDLTKNSNLEFVAFGGNKMASFDAVKVSQEVFEKLKSNHNYYGDQYIVTSNETKAGDKIDFSKYATFNGTPSEYTTYYWSEDEGDSSGSAIPESDEGGVYVFGNAYADKTVEVYAENEKSLVSFYTVTKIVKNPDAAAAPEKPTGDIEVQDISGTVKSADADKDFDAQAVYADYDPETDKDVFVLGEKLQKSDLSLYIQKQSNSAKFADKIAAFDKNFKKDDAKLYAYDIGFLYYGHVKLKGGVKLILAYPNSIAKEWNKYDVKVYHFKDFDYDKLVEIKPAQVESIAATCDKDGIHFTAPGFSYYVISVTPKSKSTGSPETGESNAMTVAAIVLAFVSIAGAGAVVYRKKLAVR